MIAEKYDFISVEDDDYFEFVSIGPKGEITKVVQFILIDQERSIYNLGLGDKNPATNEIIDNVATNNKDTDKILATIGQIGRQFLERKPDAAVLFEGNSKSRNRLYRMGISKYLYDISKNFAIFDSRTKS
ncbi:MAG: hypothetical protein IPO92_19920 [Saprospiraceae bacterium]|nr:hypothetical protein [Saprospiraceae bacterium]